MLWKNCQGVDSQRLASTYAYCSENLSDLGDRREGRSGKEGKEQRRKKTGRNTSVRKESIKVPRQRHVIIQRQVVTILDGSSKTCLSLILVSQRLRTNSEFRN